MKIKNVNLTYYAFIYDWNGTSLEWINVLGDRYKEHLVKALKTKEEDVRIKNRDELKKDLKSYLFYYYASRAECEVLVGDLFCGTDPVKYVDKMIKLDVYEQVFNNIDIMVDYIINKMGIKFKNNK